MKFRKSKYFILFIITLFVTVVISATFGPVVCFFLGGDPYITFYTYPITFGVELVEATIITCTWIILDTIKNNK